MEELPIGTLREQFTTPGYRDDYEDKEFLGGLRLVGQEWQKVWPNKPAGDDDGNEFVSWLVPRRTKKNDNGDDVTEPGLLPFSESTLGTLITILNLPRSYPNDLLGLFGLPLRLQEVCDDKGDKYLGMPLPPP